AESSPARGLIEAELVTNRRVHPVGGDDQRGPSRLAFHLEPDDAAVPREGGIHARVGVSLDPWRCGCRLKKDGGHMAAPLSTADHGQSGGFWETALSGPVTKVVAHAMEWCAADSLS